MSIYNNLIFIRNNFILRVISLILTGIIISLFSLGVLSSDKHAKIYLGILTSLSGLSLVLTGREIKRIDLILNDFDDAMTTQKFNSEFMRLADPKANPFFADKNKQPIEVETVETKEDKIYNTDFLELEPHFAILGPTGSGKSVFVDYLLTTLLDDHVLRLDPHKSPSGNQVNLGQLKSLLNGNSKVDLTVGEGRNFSQIADTLTIIKELMDFRYNKGGESANFPTVNVLVEEGPAIANSEESKEVWAEVQPILLREARKVNIRLVMVTQGQQVESLGIKGQSDLKDCYCFIRIGSFALKEAIKLKDDDLFNQLQSDYEQSNKDHKKSGSNSKFKGTCWLINGERLPYRNLSFLMEKSTLYSEDKKISQNEGNPLPLYPSTPDNTRVIEGKVENLEEKIAPIFRPSFLDRGTFSYYLSLRKLGFPHSQAIKKLKRSGKHYRDTNKYIRECLEKLDIQIYDDFSKLED